MGKFIEGARRFGVGRLRAVEVCAADLIGRGGYVVPDRNVEAGRGSRMKAPLEKVVKMARMSRRGLLVALVCLGILGSLAAAQGALHFCVRSEPKTFDPLKVEDEASVTIRYLTGGVLVRMNRQTQALEPELAQSWKVSKDGKQITFKLRSGISFSDGTPFSAADVAYTVQQLMDPALHSPTGDTFRSGPGNVETKIISPTQISITFPAPVAGNVIEICVGEMIFVSTFPGPERNVSPVGECNAGSISCCTV